MKPWTISRLVTDGPDPVTQKNIEDIVRLEKQSECNRSGAEKLAELITRVAGSMPFIVFHVIWFTAWATLNMGLIPGVRPWDPFPFSFLTLVVSLEAIFLALLVLMAQNRLTKDADKRALLDLQINLLAEQESTATLQMLEKICGHLGIEYETEEEQQLARNTHVDVIAKKLDEKLTSSDASAPAGAPALPEAGPL
jgi:uncharacterized membrane protein